MTMHLERGLTTINTKKRKKKTKFTLKQLEKWEADCKKRNKEFRRIGLHDQQMTVPEYIEYIHGRYKSKKKTETVMNTPWHHTESTYRRETDTDRIPSYVSKGGFEPCTKKEPIWYTGERRLLGIATMHKSNMVPIFEDDEGNGKKAAIDIAKMRR